MPHPLLNPPLETHQTTDGNDDSKQSGCLHLSYLDGIRALAALYVFAGHIQLQLSRMPRFAEDFVGWRGMIMHQLGYGHQAVDVFIVLSGFCLIIPVARRGQPSGGIMPFFVRRAKRILPPLYAAAVLCVLLDQAEAWISHTSHGLTAKTVLVNLFLLQDIVPDSSVNGAFWSVALEGKIYFLFPIIVWLLQRFGAVRMLLISALAAYGLSFLLSDCRVHVGECFPWYIYLFATGTAAGWLTFRPQGTPENDRMSCLTLDRRSELWQILAVEAAVTLIVTLLLRFSLVAQANYRHMAEIDAAVGAAAALMLVFLARRHQIARPLLLILQARPLVFVGTFAYSLYLVHSPLQFGAMRLLTAYGFLKMPHATLLIYGVILPAIVGMAYLFFLAFEKPFLNSCRHASFAEAARDTALSPAP